MFLLDNNGALRHEGRRYKTLTTQIVLVTMITFMLVLVFSKDYLTMRRNVEYHQPRSVQFGYAYYLEARGFCPPSINSINCSCACDLYTALGVVVVV